MSSKTRKKGSSAEICPTWAKPILFAMGRTRWRTGFTLTRKGYVPVPRAGKPVPQRLLSQKPGERTSRGSKSQFFRQPDFACFASSFNCFFECFCHANRIGSDCDRGVDEHRVCANLHGLGGLTWRTQSGI